MGGLSPGHWVIVVLVAALLFGGRRLPDAVRSIGRTLRILRSETRAIREERDPVASYTKVDERLAPEPAPSAAAAAAPAAPAAPPAADDAR